MERSHRPFPETLKKLLEEEEISQRELARRAAEHGWGTSAGRVKDRHTKRMRRTQGGEPQTAALNQMAQGKLDPSVPAMKAMAASLSISPQVFAEFRLEEARDALDWRKHGVTKALKVLGERS